MVRSDNQKDLKLQDMTETAKKLRIENDEATAEIEELRGHNADLAKGSERLTRENKYLQNESNASKQELLARQSRVKELESKIAELLLEQQSNSGCLWWAYVVGALVVAGVVIFLLYPKKREDEKDDASDGAHDDESDRDEENPQDGQPDQEKVEMSDNLVAATAGKPTKLTEEEREYFTTELLDQELGLADDFIQSRLTDIENKYVWRDPALYPGPEAFWTDPGTQLWFTQKVQEARKTLDAEKDAVEDLEFDPSLDAAPDGNRTSRNSPTTQLTTV